MSPGLARLIEFLQSVRDDDVSENDDDTAVEKRKMISWERHIQTLVLTLLLAAIIWGTNTLVDLRTKVEVFDTRLVNVNNVVTTALSEQSKRIDSIERSITVKTSDRYRAADAERDFKLRDARITETKVRCERLAAAIHDIKRDMALMSQRLLDLYPEKGNHNHRTD